MAAVQVMHDQTDIHTNTQVYPYSLQCSPAQKLKQCTLNKMKNEQCLCYPYDPSLALQTVRNTSYLQSSSLVKGINSHKT